MNSSLKTLNAWEQLERLTPPILPNTRDLTRVPCVEMEWNKKSSPTKNECITIYTCYLFSVPIESLVREMNFLLGGAGLEEGIRIPGQTFLAAIKIFEDGCPILGDCNVTQVFQELQRLKASSCGGHYKPLEQLVELWFQSLFLDDAKTEIVSQNKTSKSPPISILTSKKKFLSSDVTSFQDAVSQADPALNLDNKCACVGFLQKEILHQKTITKQKVESLPSGSFFLNDICLAYKEMQANKAGKALKLFLSAQDAPKSYDWVKQPDLMLDVCEPKDVPAGRWPVDPYRSLYIGQQAAVNTVIKHLNQKEGMVAINGPPGTGKTTLLRDVIADVIVKRASRMACLEHPDDLFKNVFSVGKIRFSLLNPEFSSCDDAIVVASSNNQAVENISRELPVTDAIFQKRDQNEDYFSDVAETLFSIIGCPKKCWGMISAHLGKKENCKDFVLGFWLKGLRELLKRETFEDREALFFEARDDFNKTWLDFRRLLDFFKQLKDAHYEIEELEEEKSQIKKRIRILQTEINNKKKSTRNLEVSISELENLIDDLRSQKNLLRDNKPRLPALWLLFTHPLQFFRKISKPHKEWKKAIQQVQKKILGSFSKRSHLQIEVKKLRDAISNEKLSLNKNESLFQEFTDRVSFLRQKQVELNKYLGKIDLHLDYSEKKYAEKCLTQPYNSPTLNKVRNDLFFKSLALHKAAILYHRNKFIENLDIATKIVHGTWMFNFADESLLKNLWAALFFVVPVISTTLASFENLFKGLTSKSIGWLLIDEAGQVPPQQAVGALCRAKRAVVIGDPMQIEPIVNMPRAITEKILQKYQIKAALFSPNENSVQTIADRHSIIGTWIKQGDKKIWTGIPLRVHRRCNEPMFSLSNAIAYGRQMVQGKKSPAIEGCVLGKSRWYDIQGLNLIRKHTYEEELHVLESLLSQFEAVDEIIFVVTPFVDVKEELQKALYPKYSGMIKIGTIHTFQGKEARVVFLVLGGNRLNHRALQWASSSPNILNTAITRAKEHLYVIGNRQVWKSYGFFSFLDKAFNSMGIFMGDSE